MRLDKFLKVSRIIKRRTVANQVCDMQKIKVNNKIAKASHDVKLNDIIEISMGEKTTKFKVIDLRENPRKENAKDNYMVLS